MQKAKDLSEHGGDPAGGKSVSELRDERERTQQQNKEDDWRKVAVKILENIVDMHERVKKSVNLPTRSICVKRKRTGF